MKVVGILGSLWAIVGIFGLIGGAAWRLSAQAAEALQMNLGVVHWIVLVGFTLFMAHAEGYRGFQKSFSPRTAARIHHLLTSPRLLHAFLAPLFGMGYFHADRRTRIVAHALTFGIVVLVLLVRLLPQPWRGIIDTGVVVGLTWGLVSLAVFTIRAFAHGRPDASPCVPT